MYFQHQIKKRGGVDDSVLKFEGHQEDALEPPDGGLAEAPLQDKDDRIQIQVMLPHLQLSKMLRVHRERGEAVFHCARGLQTYISNTFLQHHY